VQKIGRALQADFFREVGGAYEYLCRARAVRDVITFCTMEHPLKGKRDFSCCFRRAGTDTETTLRFCSRRRRRATQYESSACRSYVDDANTITKTK